MASRRSIRAKSRRSKTLVRIERKANRRMASLETLEPRALLAADWQNPFNTLDSSDDGLVAPIDALLIINELNAPQLGNGLGELPATRPDPDAPFIDPTGDQIVAPIDALLVINALNEDETAPVVSLGLERDTAPGGAVNNDRITSKGAVVGQVHDDLTGVDRLEVSVDGSAAVLATLNRRTGEFRFDPSGLPDGERSYAVRAFDALGNSSAPISLVFTLDTQRPAAPTLTGLTPESDSGLSNRDAITRVRTPTIVGTSPGGARVLLSADGTPVGSITEEGTWSFTTDELSDGVKRFTAIAVDVAGNESPSTPELIVQIDTVAPPAPNQARLDPSSDTGTSNSDSLTNDTTPAVLVELAAAGVAELFFGDTKLGEATGNGLVSVPAGVLGEGTHSLRARATDVAGNTSGFVDVPAFTLDTSPPAAPAFDLSIGSDSGILQDQTTSAARVTLIGTTSPQALLELVGMGLTSLSSQTGNFQFAQVPLQLGANELTIQVRDPAGNVSTGQVTIQRTEAGDVEDPVLRWNSTLLETIRRDASVPPVATRAMAMTHAAIYDAVNAITGTPSLYVMASAVPGASLEAAVGAAAHEVLSYLYPGQKTALDQALANTLAQVPDGPSETNGIAVGRVVGTAIVDLRRNDGWNEFVDYLPGDDPGEWQPTGPMFEVALLPQWATLDTFLLQSPDQFRPDGPPEMTSPEYAADFEEVKTLGRLNSTQRTAEQTQIARFWADGAGTYTPPGHWNLIAHELAADQGLSVADNARLFALLNVALGDTSIAAWDAKYAYGFWRPETAIQEADTDGNSATTQEANWSSLLITPPFPEYVSGHSSYSGAAARILSAVFGENVAFKSTSIGLPGVERSFPNFRAAAEEAGRSRIFGGIHYQFSNSDGLAMGRELADYVLDAFSLATDTVPPAILLNSVDAPVVSGNRTVTGRAFDNLSGLTSITLQIDGGAASPVSLDAQGGFSVTTQFSVAGDQDGPHVLRFRAEDASGLAAVREYHLTLDTRTPTIDLSSPLMDSELAAGSRLVGRANGTGSSILSVTYQWDDGRARPILFDTTSGAFDVPLDLSSLTAGAHTLSVTTRDSAGNHTSQTVNVSLPSLVPFDVTAFTPLRGATEIGTTYRPQVFFSRAVDPASIDSTNFYATNAAGERVEARVVPAADGRFAWLFFANPLPGGADVAVHLDGSTIRAAADGNLLDADRDGQAGGVLRWTFTTVSLTPVQGTSLTGRVVDPGPDLKPMTFDDVRAGADGALNTADDVFLFPIAGVKVYIVGLESSAQYTDAQGRFHFDSVPTGNVKIAVDGLTATSPPAGFYFPEMVMDAQMTPGTVNWVMTEMEDVYLPRLQTSILQDVSDSEVTEVTVGAEAAPNLTPEQRQSLTIEIQPGSLVGADGLPLANGQVGISTVPPELVRDMLPPGLLQHTFDITVQAPGVATFNEPAPMTAPNIFNAPPGTKLNFLSFDHTTGRLVIEGTGTVSADGKYVVTDPGTGITKPGWHGWTPPGGCNGSGGNPGPSPTNKVTPNVSVEEPIFVTDGNSSSGPQKSFQGPAKKTTKPPSNDPCKPSEPEKDEFVRIRVDVDGPLKEFLDDEGDVPFNRTISLKPGETRELALNFKTYDDMFRGTGGFTKLERDRLYGTRITVTEERGKGGKVESKDVTVYSLYRWVAVVDPESAKMRDGDVAAFFKTNTDISREKKVDLFLPSRNTTTEIANTGTADFGGFGRLSGKEATWTFSPILAGEQFADLELTTRFTVEGQSYEKEIGLLDAQGTGIDPTKISVNEGDFASVVYDVVSGLEMIQFTYIVQPGDTLTKIARDHATTINVIVAHNNIADPDLILDGQSLQFPAAVYKAGQGLYPVSASFASEFAGFMPWNRSDLGAGNKPGASGVDDDNNGTVDDATEIGWEATDDAFAPTQLAGLLLVSTTKGTEILNAVMDDYKDQSTIEVVGSNAGADVTMTWQDETLFPDDTGALVPVFGAAEFDRRANDDPPNTSAWLENYICTTNACDIGDVAKLYALSNGLNASVPNQGWFAVAINMQFNANQKKYALATTPVSFAEYTANTVSHELGHTFGLLDAYGRRNQPTEPWDIMMSGGPDDGNLTFSAVNKYLLKAAMGEQPDPLAAGNRTEALNALRLYQRRFWQPNAANPAIRDRVGITEAPLMAVFRASEPVIDGWSETFGTIAAGTEKTLSYQITNLGLNDLSITDIQVTGASEFTLNAAAARQAVIKYGESATFSITYRPVSTGASQATVTIQGNDQSQPQLKFVIDGEAFSAAPRSRINVPDSNNLGGALLGTTTSVPNALSITNGGRSTLRITGIRIVEGTGFQLTGVPANLQATPIELAENARFTFGATFTPTQLGLQRARIEVTTNDATQPVHHASLSGTGVSPGFAAAWGDDYVAIETPSVPNFTTLRTVSDGNGSFEFFMPPSETYHLAMFDPATGLVADGSGVTAASGDVNDVTSWLVFEPSTDPDSDFDGLPDDIEFAVGTLPGKSDSDADGLDDYEEIILGLDPSGSGALPTGIVSGVALPGPANEVVVEAAPTDIRQKTAYVATGDHGLAIVDVSQARTPTIRGLLDLPGDAVDLAVDVGRGVAVVASGEDNLHLVNITNSAAPVLRETISGIEATQVEIINGIAYVADGAAIRSFDLATGDRLNSFVAPGSARITGMAREGSTLFTLDEESTLRAISTNDFTYTLRGSAVLSGGAGQLFVSNGIAYVAAQSSGGYMTVDVSDPSDLQLISGSDAPNGAPGQAIMPNGSGLGILVGSAFGGNFLDVMDVRDPTDTFRFLTRQNLPAAPRSVAVASGLAYVANGTAGLQIVNFLALDTGELAPTVSISTSLSDAEPSSAGFQVLEGAPIPIRVDVNDDTQLRNVELVVSGTVVANAISAPFFFEVTAPAAGQSLNIQVRATDTGLNTGLSTPLMINSVADTSAPFVIASTPEANGAGFSLTQIVLRFNEALREDALAQHGGSATLVNLGDDGLPGGGDDTPVTLDEVVAASPFLVQFSTGSPIAGGKYRLTVPAAAVADRFGNTPVSPVTLEFSAYDVPEGTVVWISDTNGDWDDPANWSSAEVPNGDVDVLIDRVGIDVRVNVTSGISARNVFSKETLVLDGGSLEASERVLALAGLTIQNGGTLTVEGGGAELIVEGPAAIGGGNLVARNGAQVRLDQLTEYRYDRTSSYYYYSNYSLVADGAGSRIDLSNVRAIFGGDGYYYGKPHFQASGGGQILLGAAAQVRGAAQFSADGVDSRIDLGSLTNWIDTGSPYETSSISATSNGTIVAPLLSETQGVLITVDGTLEVAQLRRVDDGGIEVHGQAVQFNQLTSLSNSSVAARNGAQLTIPLITELDFQSSSNQRLSAENNNSALAFPNLTRIGRSGSSWYTGLELSASNGGHLLFPKLVEVDTSANVRSIGTGSEIDLRELIQFDAPENQSSEIHAQSGGRIRVPKLTRIANADLFVGGPIETSQLSAIVESQVTVAGVAVDFSHVADVSGSGIVVEGGVVVELPLVATYDRPAVFSDVREFRASGEGSVLSLPNLTHLKTEGTNYSWYGPNVTIVAIDKGIINLPQVTALSGSIGVQASHLGSELHLPLLRDVSNSGTNGNGYLRALNDALVEIPLVTTLRNVDLTVDGPINTSQLTSVRDGLIDVQISGADLGQVSNIDGSGLRARAGITVSLPSVTSYVASTVRSTDWTSNGSGAQLTLANLASITATSANTYSHLTINAHSTAQINLPALTHIDAAVGITANDAVIDMPLLTSFSEGNLQTESSLRVESNGMINVPLLTTLHGVALYVDGTIDSAQLTSVTGGAIHLSRATDLSNLNNIDGSTVEVENGVNLVLDHITSYTQGNEAYVDRWFQTYDAGSILVFPNLVEISASTTTGSEFRLEAYHGGKLRIPQLATIHGNVRVYSYAANSEVDLSSLTRIDETNTSVTSSIEASGQGQVRIPLLTQFENVNLTVDGPLETAQITSFRQGTLRVGRTTDLAQLAQIHQASIEVYGGVIISLPGITSATLNGSAQFSVSGNNSVLTFPELTGIVGGNGNQDKISLRATSNARLTFPKLTQIATAVDIYSSGTSSEVDLSELTTIQDDETPSSSIAAFSGRVRIPRVTELRGIDLTVAGTMDTAQLTKIEASTISVQGSPVDFSHVTSIDGSRVSVNGGVTVTLPLVNSYRELPGIVSSLSLSASGANCVLNLPNLTSITGNITSENATVTLSAQSGAKVQVGAVTSITGQLQIFSSGAGSDIDLSSWNSFTEAGESANSVVSATSGGRLRMPQLESMTRTDLTIGGTIDTTQLEEFTHGLIDVQGIAADFSSLQNLSHSGVSVRGGVTVSFPQITAFTNSRTYYYWQTPVAFRATGVGSTLSFPNLITLSQTPSSNFALEATSGGQLQLAAVTSLQGSFSIRSDGDGSTVNLSNLTSFANQNASGNSEIKANNEGRVQIPKITSLDRVNLYLDGTIDTAQLNQITRSTIQVSGRAPDFNNVRNIDGAAVDVYEGGTVVLPQVTGYNALNLSGRSFSASGAGSLLDLRSLGSITAGGIILEASEGGQLLVNRLSSVNGITTLRARGAGSTLDAAALVSVTAIATSSASRFEASEGGRVRVPRFTQLDHVDLVVDGVLEIGQLTSVTNGHIEITRPFPALASVSNLDGSSLHVSEGATLSLPLLTSYRLNPLVSTGFTATGDGAVLDLSNLSTIAVQEDLASYPWFYFFEISASDAAHVDLSGLTALTPQVSVNVDSSGTNSEVDLQSLETIGGAGRRSTLTTSLGGRIRIPQVTELHHVALNIGGIVDTAQLTAVTHGGIHLAGVAPDFPNLVDVSGSSLSVTGDVIWVLSGLTTLSLDGQYVELKAEGAEARLEFPNLTSILRTGAEHESLILNAFNGGELKLPLVTSLIGATSVSSSGASSDVDLSSLVTMTGTDDGSFSSALFTANDGRIRIPNITTLDWVDLTVDGTIETSQITAITNSQITLREPTPLPLLANINGSGIVLEDVSLSLPLITSYASTHDTNRRFAAIGNGTANSSVLDLSNLTSISVSQVLSQYYYYIPLEVSASRGGRVDLSKVSTVTGQVAFRTTSGGGEIDLSSLTSLNDTDINYLSVLSTESGGRIKMPLLTQLRHTTLQVGGTMDTSQITSIIDGLLAVTNQSANLSQLSNLDGSSVQLGWDIQLTLPLITAYQLQHDELRSFLARGAAGRLEFPNLETITVRQDGPGLSLEVSSGGKLLLPALKTVTGQVEIESSYAGSLISLPALTSIVDTDSTLRSSLSAYGGGTIQMPLITEIDLVSLYVDGPMDTAQLTSLTNSVLSVYEGSPSFAALANINGTSITAGGATANLPAVTQVSQASTARDITWSANSGGRLNFPNLASLVPNSTIPTSSQDYSGAFEVNLTASSQGRIDLHQLTTFPGGVVQVSAVDVGSQIDLSGLASVVSDHPTRNHSFRADNRGQLLLSNMPRALRRIDLTLGENSSLGLDASALTEFVNGTLIIEGMSPSFSSLTTLDDSAVQISGGGSVAFPLVTTYALQNAPFDRRLTATGAGSTLSLPALATITGSSGNEYGRANDTSTDAALQLNFEAFFGGTIDLPALTAAQGSVTFTSRTDQVSQPTSLNAPQLNSLISTHPRANAGLFAESGLLTVGSLPSTLDRVDLTVGSGFSANISNLTSFTNAQLELMVPVNLANLVDIDGSGILVSEGVNLSLPNITSYDGSSLLDSRTFGAGGTGSKLRLANLPEIIHQGAADSWLVLAAWDGGTLELPGVTKLEVPDVGGDNRSIDIEAVNGGTIVLTGLSRWVDLDQVPDSYFSVASGTVKLNPTQTMIQGVDADLESYYWLNNVPSVVEVGTLRWIDGTLWANGPFGRIQGNLINEGSIDTSSYMLVINGNYTQAATGELEVTVWDQGSGGLQIGGSAVLDGELHLESSSSYVPLATQHHQVLLANSRQGVFATLDGEDIVYNLEYLPDRVIATPATNGDGEGEAPEDEDEFLLSLDEVFSQIGERTKR